MTSTGERIYYRNFYDINDHYCYKNETDKKPCHNITEEFTPDWWWYDRCKDCWTENDYV